MSDVYAKLRGLSGWDYDLSGTVWLRARCQCEYCDTDLTADFGTYMWGREYDHILPKELYRNVCNERGSWLVRSASRFRNLALSCCFCNRLKGDQDFAEGMIGRDVVDITDEQRQAVIEIIRSRLRIRSLEARSRAQADYQAIRKLVQEYGFHAT